jgi:hypothetical protein
VKVQELIRFTFYTLTLILPISYYRLLFFFQKEKQKQKTSPPSLKKYPKQAKHDMLLDGKWSFSWCCILVHQQHCIRKMAFRSHSCSYYYVYPALLTSSSCRQVQNGKIKRTSKPKVYRIILVARRKRALDPAARGSCSPSRRRRHPPTRRGSTVCPSPTCRPRQADPRCWQPRRLRCRRGGGRMGSRRTWAWGRACTAYRRP